MRAHSLCEAPTHHFTGQKFGTIGAWSAEEQRALLRQLLLPLVGRSSATQLAVTLMERFGSLPAVISAAEPRLREVPGLGVATVGHLKAVLEVAANIVRSRVDLEAPRITAWSELYDHLRLCLGFETVEQFRILFFNKRSRLIAEEVQQIGTVDHVAVYPREVVRRCLELSATSLILVHNHPSGDTAPSSGDVRMTKEIVTAAKLFGIIIHDHIIVGRSGHTSLRSLGLL